MTLTLIKANKVFDGTLQQFRHHSAANHCDMQFSIFLPKQAENAPVPVLYWLSGLTCTDENFMQKSGAQRIAAALGMAIVAPDTSPRGEQVPDDPDGSYDFGLGAGFYLDATQAPWSTHYNMYSYIVSELPALIEANFPVTSQRAISGHSMGGHGALTIGLKHQDKYSSISAFSPIVNPMACPWGRKAFNHYLGNDETTWQAYDTCALLAEQSSVDRPVLVAQGEADEFLAQQLCTNNLEALAINGIEIHRYPGYDHSYYFIASFIEQHLKFHFKHFSTAE